MTYETPDLVIGVAFAGVFVTYGLALRQRLLAYRDAVMDAQAELDRRRASGLSAAEAQAAYDDAAEALNAVLERFPSNLMGRLMKVAKVPVTEAESPV
jgi:hypothetical protein